MVPFDKRVLHSPESSAPWFATFERHLAERRLQAALRLLNRVIEEDLPLLDIDESIARDRRVAWLCRVDLLREMGKLTEALAWACLECELHPDNVAAQSVKDELKRQTGFGGRAPTGSGFPRGSHAQRFIRWPGLAGMRALRAELERDVVHPLLDPARYESYGLSLPNGILFYGPPGCGKTFIAGKLAEAIGFHFVEIKPSDVGSAYVHGSQLRIRRIFDDARQTAPTMVFFDEFDAMAPARTGESSNRHYDEEVNEFLVQLNNCAKDKILVVCATNFADKLDAAVRRPGRIDKEFYIGPPDIEARVELFRLYLSKRPVSGVDYLALGDATDWYTPVEILELVNEAARIALSLDAPISQAHLLRAVSLRPAMLRPQGKDGNRIGFRRAER